MAPRRGLSAAKPWTLVLSEPHYDRLYTHLFPGDGDEHGAAILAGTVETADEVRLLVRDVVLAQDGTDFVEGDRSYRQLKAAFTMPLINEAREDALVYLAIHNHGGEHSVSFSSIDRDSHRRNYPALLAITGGTPVGALVLARGAVAGSIWLRRDLQVPLHRTVIVGRNRRIIHPHPVARGVAPDSLYDRQVRLLGHEGQKRLHEMRVGVIGAGGIGLALVEHLGRVGVGHFVVADPDVVTESNLPRLIGAPRDAARHKWRRRGWRFARRPMLKVELCRHVLDRMPFPVHLLAFDQPAEQPDPLRALVGCDYIFHAADTVTSRYFFNALAHQYLIPGVQIGSKIRVASDTGHVREGTSILRRLSLTEGCLLCRGVVDARRLQLEAMTPSDRAAQDYVEGADDPAPSIVTVNALGVAEAVHTFLLHATGLWPNERTSRYKQHDVFSGEVVIRGGQTSANCPHCSLAVHSRFARGDATGAPPPIGPAP